MYNQRKSFEDVKAWQLGRVFKNKIYTISNSFPKNELYGLVQQIRRAAVSITANIAEGYGRYSFQENINFCRISRGSTLETLDHLYTAINQKYITQQEFNTLYHEGREVERAINGYISFLKQQNKNKIIK
ncbi:four helix bundle protein [Candidatus Parcubacteria bacterium]|nr:four helix bundle protein [Candidatus Parcubacteria bacterium]